MLEVHWQGHPQVLVNGGRVKFPTLKCLLLVVYLGLEGHTPRKHLAGLFWPEQESGAALRNLRSELHRLSRTSVGPYLQVSAQDVGPVGQWQVQAVGMSAEQALQGVNLPEGALLDWLEALRQRQEDGSQRRLREQVRELESAGAWAQAREVARALTRLNPLDEGAWLDVVRLSALLDEQTEAHAAFQACQQVLQAELGVEPGSAFQVWLQGPLLNQAAQALSLPLLGRAELWRQLSRASGPMLLLGEAGQGKTRLVTEFSARRRPRLIVRGLVQGQHWPLGAISVLLRDLQERAALDGLDPNLRAVVQHLSPPNPGAPSPFSSSPAAGTDSLLGALTIDAAAWQGHLFDQLGLALAALLGTGTLILEDLHDFDALSLQAVGFILARLSPRALVILTARPLELEWNGAATALVQHLRGRHLLQTLTVNPLEEAEVLLAVRTLTRTSSGTRLAAMLHGVTGGNPLFLLEAWRHLQERGQVWQDERGWHTDLDDPAGDATLSIPGRVQDTIAARLNLLPEPARRLLEALCVAGLPQRSEVLEAVTGLTPWATAQGVAALEHAGFVRGGRLVHVTHELYRRATLAVLGDLRRSVLHRELARVLTEQQAPALDIAEHYLAAERSQQAAEWFLRAAREAAALYAFQEALELLERTLALHPSQAVAAEAHLLAARIRLSLSHNTQASTHLDALRHLTQAGDLEDVRQSADLLELQFHFNQSAYPQVLFSAEHLLTRDLPAGARGEVHQLLADTLIRMARVNEAEGHLTQAEHLALNTADQAVRQARSWSARIRLHLFRREFVQAEGLARQVMRQAERLNHPTLLNVAYTSLSATLLAQGKFAQAEPICREGLAFAQRIGHHSLRAVMGLNLSNALIQLRQYAQGQEVLERALEAPDLSADQRAMLRRNLGTVKLWLGDLGLGLTITREALQQAQTLGAQQAVLVRQLGLMRLHAEIGHAFALSQVQEMQRQITRLEFEEARHHLLCTRLWRGLSFPDARFQSVAQTVQTLPFEADEAEAHHLLLSEVALRARQFAAAQQHLSAAPAGPWRTELHLKVQHAQKALSESDLETARQMLRDPQWQALHLAKLARTIARISQAQQDGQEAQRRAHTLLDSLAGHPEQGSLQKLLN